MALSGITNADRHSISVVGGVPLGDLGGIEQATLSRKEVARTIGLSGITNAERPSISVVVVNYNAGSLLTQCVTSVISQGAAQVVVVDNASSDGSVSALERALPAAAGSGLRVVESVVNLGFAAACNLGVRAKVNNLTHKKHEQQTCNL